jgi:hypothetical protein
MYIFFYRICIIMPKFNNGKNTTSVIFYRTGIPNSAKNFGTLATVNYSILKQLTVYNKRLNISNNYLF